MPARALELASGTGAKLLCDHRTMGTRNLDLEFPRITHALFTVLQVVDRNQRLELRDSPTPRMFLAEILCDRRMLVEGLVIHIGQLFLRPLASLPVSPLQGQVSLLDLIDLVSLSPLGGLLLFVKSMDVHERCPEILYILYVRLCREFYPNEPIAPLRGGGAE